MQRTLYNFKGTLTGALSLVIMPAVLYLVTMLDMRLRLPELMDAAGIRTAYGLAKATKGAMTITNAQRLIDAAGHPERIALKTLDILCDALGVTPGELFERDKPKRR